MAKTYGSDYPNELINLIKDAGQEIIDRAEQMVAPETALITDFSITINFNQELGVPTISWKDTVIVTNTINRHTSEVNQND